MYRYVSKCKNDERKKKKRKKIKYKTTNNQIFFSATVPFSILGLEFPVLSARSLFNFVYFAIGLGSKKCPCIFLMGSYLSLYLCWSNLNIILFLVSKWLHVSITQSSNVNQEENCLYSVYFFQNLIIQTCRANLIVSLLQFYLYL
jgi:hypothetical protein